MRPVLFEIGPISLYSYGLMLGIAFLAGNIFITRELRRLKMDPGIATAVTMLALLGGVAGAKLFHVIENFSEFLDAPKEILLSSGGLTWYGGFLVAVPLVFLYLRKKKISMLRFSDIAAPSLALGYGLGRVGCQLAGDGCYGQPWTGFCAMTYPNGTVSTLAERNPALVALFSEIYPDLPIPADIAVHPTPVYEIILAVALFTFLYLRRKKDHPTGNSFGWFLILHGISRFAVEFIRLNPIMFAGLSQAQVLSIAMIAWGSFLVLRRSQTLMRAQPV